MRITGIRTQLMLLIAIIVASCNRPKSEEVKQNDETVADSTVESAETDASLDTTYVPDSEYATYYLVIADTGSVYSVLHKKMYNIYQKIGQRIDTLGRYYNPEKELICLPDSSDDEMYAGEYFPRRDLSNSLSLEHFDFYNNGEGMKTIILLAGIYENEASADSALAILSKVEPGCFKMKSEIFQGCMH